MNNSSLKQSHQRTKMNSSKSKDSDKITEACCMAFTPQSSPTRGGEVIFITFSDEFPLPDNGDFYMVFEGRNQRHVTTAQQINTFTLRAIVPDHDQAEKVTLTVYCAQESKVGPLSSHKFLYWLETEQIIAKLLADSASDSKLFECLASLTLISDTVSKEYRDTLDSRITNAFEFLDLPPTWSLFGENGVENFQNKNGQETLLHLSARLGFTQLATYLLDQPGSMEALHIQDKSGRLPEDIAREKGMKLLADMFSRGPGDCEKRTAKDMSKPQVKKSELGTTTISSYKTQQQNSLEKDIEMLQDINSLVEEEMKKRVPKFRHSWPVRRKNKDTIEDASSSDEEIKQINRELSPKKFTSQLNSMSSVRSSGGGNRQLLEQNLKRLRAINEEIQKLRMVNSQRGSREAGRGGMQGKHLRRLSCPSLSAQDLQQAQIIAGMKSKEEKSIVNGVTDQKVGKASPLGVNLRTSPDKIRETIQREEDSSSSADNKLLTVDGKSDVRRAHSWGKHEEKPELNKRVSSSLDDLTKEADSEEKVENEPRSRIQALKNKRPVSLNLDSPKEEGNKLADILDSIKKASDDKQNLGKASSNVSITSLTDVDVNVNHKDNGLLGPNKSNLHTKSYSYSCLADLKLGEDGNPIEDKKPGSQFSPEVQKRNLSKVETQMSLMDFLNEEETQDKASNRLSLEEFLGENGPDLSADDSEEVEKEKQEAGKGIRRLSMLFGSKSSSKQLKRELPKIHKGSNRSSLRKEKSFVARSKDSEDIKRETGDAKEPFKTALGRRASGIPGKSSKSGEQLPALPNPGLLTRAGRGSVSSRSSMHNKPTSPLPFRSRSFTVDDENKEKDKDKGKDKDKPNTGVSPDASGDDEDYDEGEVGDEHPGDPDLDIKPEPEAWSVAVDKKILKSLSAKDIKRQDVIHELIQTEVHHVRTLKIMQKIFYKGMLDYLSQDTAYMILPRLDDLLQINGDFLNRLRASEGENTIVNSIGDILEEQFSGENGEKMKSAYGEFCSNHMEGVELYKKLLRTDKKFADFIKKCNTNKYCRRLSIPECITLVTQRLTKYPMLIEAIVKTTKESKPDFSSLKNSITLVRMILQSVDQTIKNYEKQKLLQDMKLKLDLKVTVNYKNGKIKNIDFASNTSKLVHDGVLLWKTARGKLNETRVLIMEEMLVFLQEKDQKYSLLSLDQKAPVVRLKKLIVREVATDRKAIFLVSTSSQGPEMYEIVCESAAEKKRWMEIIREAVANAPGDENPDDSSLITTAEGERRKIILRRASVLIEQVHNKDLEDADRGKHLAEMQELVSQIEAMEKEKSKMDADKSKELAKTKDSLVIAMQQVQYTVSSEDPSSEEAQSDTQACPSSLSVPGGVPKRAETFSGFDSKLKPDNLNKDNINRASSMRTERPGSGFPSRQLPGAASPVAGASPKTKHKRRSSGGGGGGWSFLSKSSGKEDKEQSGSTGDLASDSPSSSPSPTPTPSPLPGQEPDTATDSDGGVKSARFRPVKEQGGNTSPPLQIKADHQQGRLKHNLREQVQQLSSPRALRKALPFIKDEEDKEREQKDQSPAGATQEVIYF
ncbi:rho guanine nucleotide exchange factor 28-like isoform X3 [Stylophora pistillata]|uniref:Rho guanine nucleotide exchange factor 18 n=1 Tax=Stylophora pistillata TaxID=50429 RepID=A0A2B4SRC4_STYPI|nr:rho guanine nucleotide exchange factor 28-like isoform X3 [Stylophora pistillata]PFX30955.1 Rho guanine nucleotide exchange factor 18 [Stylophora pistillata]